MEAVRALTDAQGAGGLGPADGQAPPKAPTVLSYGDDQDQGPADNYAAFKVAFKQHYGFGGATNNLWWADTFRQRNGEDIR
jgi:hypothetical protein